LTGARESRHTWAMAKTRTRSRSHSLARFAPRTSKPIVIRTTKVVKAAKRHASRKGHSQQLLSTDRMEMVGAAFAVGILEKMQFVKDLPSLPLLGKTGTVGVAAYFLSNGGRNKMADNIASAALTVAGYMMGATGSIVGDMPEVSGYVAGF
jgi:hypothetical protein